MKLSIYSIKQRIQRYWPGEIFGTIFAVAWWYLASTFIDNSIIIWYAGAFSENIGYYWYFLRREKRDQRILYNKKASIRQLTVWLLSEFGPGEVLDTLIIRPLSMWLWSKRWWAFGLFVWKCVADSIFYIFATVLYYRRTKRNIDVLLHPLSEKINRTTIDKTIS